MSLVDFLVVFGQIAIGAALIHGLFTRFAAIMRRLSAKVPKGLEEGAVGYLSTHPPTPERIAEAERAAGD